MSCMNDHPKVKVRKRKVASEPNPSQLLGHASQLGSTKINEIKKRRRDLLRRINYSHTFSVVVLPALALGYIFRYSDSIVPQNPHTVWFGVIYFNLTLLAFSAGYHKLFTHKSFTTSSSAVGLFFAIFGASMGLGSIRYWAALHRAHHQFTDDTERDPYSIKRGFLWSHWGWLIKKPKIVTFYQEFIEHEFPGDPELAAVINEIDADDHDLDDLDLQRKDYAAAINQMVLWQHANYVLLFILTTILLPILVTVFWCNDTAVNGLVYPGILRMFLCQQCALSTESVCHLGELHVTIPTQPFNDKNSSFNCNNPIVTLLTYGQSQQNFHHEFPHDYRCSPSIFSFDPTKWFLFTLSKLGLISDLSVTPANLIVQLRIQQKQRLLNQMKSRLNWGTPISKLPLITPGEFKRLISTTAHKDRIYIVISNIIHDITPFMDQHPGGVPLLKASHGKDATKAFFGGVYGHSTAAQNLLATMRIGYLDIGDDEEVWNQIVQEEREVEEADSRQSQYQTAEAA